MHGQGAHRKPSFPESYLASGYIKAPPTGSCHTLFKGTPTLWLKGPKPKINNLKRGIVWYEPTICRNTYRHFLELVINTLAVRAISGIEMGFHVGSAFRALLNALDLHRTAQGPPGHVHSQTLKEPMLKQRGEHGSNWTPVESIQESGL